ncbi:type I-MYXAN CRISPR-associated protein Cmx8 [Cyanobacterium sp. Dongsha4]|uniref:type I-MYXAN CRISPR-associated protein Cmx8 n=1 Tax=Cyanobacterium sp. DS4 TaxID=2878255 RepID=UPI002E80CF46|nr:type I-MYXAN CRISPR-associated protein Cmx8 [Cyanobacterium sp. Dongsha4]WVL00257.1 type I-MYXAN CRISPR-associated protein Cmx8 [Cyanobacterium sp. Dongsha4]
MAGKEIIELSYQLAELPSTQHRAGLAGLVLMVQEIENQETLQYYESALLELDNLDEFGVSVKFNLEGLKALFDVTFGAFSEERWSTKKDKKKEYTENEIRQVEKKDKGGKIKTVTEYSYSVVIPHGAFLPYLDESGEDKNGIWIKLWRDMYWSIIRGRDTQRTSFKERCDKNQNLGKYIKDVKEQWNNFSSSNKVAKQSSTYFLGAESFNSENIPIKDTVSYQFLLNFAPFVFQVYRPTTLDKDGKRDFSKDALTYALAIPDIADLKRFCYFFPKLLKQRSNEKLGYSPKESIIDLANESALNFFILEDRIARDIGEQSTKKSILGVEVIHVKPGQKLNFFGFNYLEPITTQTDQYKQIKDSYWCPWFRKQRLTNLLNSIVYSDNQEGKDEEIPPWFGFDDLLSRIPRKWLETNKDYFSHDARILFNQEILNKQGVTEMSKNNTKIRQYSEIVYRVCQSYVRGKLKVKYGLEWDKVKGNPKLEKDYSENKTKIANEAFLAVRSRTEKQAFIDYFVSTLYPFIKKEEFTQFAEDLFNKTDEIRALTLLALSSQFSSTKEDNKSNKNPESNVA